MNSPTDHSPAVRSQRISSSRRFRVGPLIVCAMAAATWIGANLFVTPTAYAQSTDYSGTWLFVQETVSVSNVMVVGRVRSSTVATVVYELASEGDRLFGSGQVCSVSLDSGTRFVDTILSDNFIDAIPTPQFDAEIVQTADGARLEHRRFYSVVGADLEDDATSRMPASANDSRITDGDNDGHPGVTVHVTGMVNGDIYVAQRGWTELSAEETAPFVFEGDVDFGMEQVVLGATRGRLENAPDTRPDSDESSFRLIRLPAGTNCRSASAQR